MDLANGGDDLIDVLVPALVIWVATGIVGHTSASKPLKHSDQLYLPIPNPAGKVCTFCYSMDNLI